MIKRILSFLVSKFSFRNCFKCDARIETPEGFFELGEIELPIPPFPDLMIHLSAHRKMLLGKGCVEGEMRITQVIYNLPRKKLMIIGTNIMESKLKEMEKEWTEKEMKNE